MARFPVDDPDAWDLWQFGVEHLVFVLDSADDAVFEEVSVPFVLF